MEQLFWLGFVGFAVAGIFALLQAKKVLAYSEGTERMQKLAAAIREGANLVRVGTSIFGARDYSK